MQKIKFKHPSDRMLIFILVLVIALQAAVLWGFGWRINKLSDQVNGTGSANLAEKSLGAFPFKVYVRDATQLLYPNEGVVNVQNNRLYVPELRISLPLNQLSRDLRYGYYPPATTGTDAVQASFQSKASLVRLINNFADVPCQQRLVGLAVNQKDGYQNGGRYAGSVSLADGRILYLYTNTTAATKNCDQFWANETPDAVVTLFKQAQSY